MRFRGKKFKSCQILEQKIYNVSDFKWIFLQRVSFWINYFTTRQILKKNIFFKSMILKKRNFC